MAADGGRAVKVDDLAERQTLGRDEEGAEDGVEQVEDVAAEALVGGQQPLLLLGLIEEFLKEINRFRSR